jgi:hypothetical protein
VEGDTVVGIVEEHIVDEPPLRLDLLAEIVREGRAPGPPRRLHLPVGRLHDIHQPLRLTCPGVNTPHFSSQGALILEVVGPGGLSPYWMCGSNSSRVTH